MDALPVREQTGLPYASTQTVTDSTGKTVPVMHACGHDMHVAWLVGAAALMAETRDAWKGTLMPVFQPAEETGTGAQAMIDGGLLTRFRKPDVILGQHDPLLFLQIERVIARPTARLLGNLRGQITHPDVRVIGKNDGPFDRMNG